MEKVARHATQGIAISTVAASTFGAWRSLGQVLVNGLEYAGRTLFGKCVEQAEYQPLQLCFENNHCEFLSTDMKNLAIVGLILAAGSAVAGAPSLASRVKNHFSKPKVEAFA